MASMQKRTLWMISSRMIGGRGETGVVFTAEAAWREAWEQVRTNEAVAYAEAFAIDATPIACKVTKQICEPLPAPVIGRPEPERILSDGQGGPYR